MPELRLGHAFDFSALSFDLRFGGGAALFTQRFEARGVAPARDSLSPYVLLDAAAGFELGHGYMTGIGAAGETHFLRFEPRSETGKKSLGEFALRVNGFVRKWF